MVGCLLNTHPLFKLERVTSLSVWEKRMFALKVSASSYESCPLSRTCCQCSPSAILSFELFFAWVIMCTWRSCSVMLVNRDTYVV